MKTDASVLDLLRKTVGQKTKAAFIDLSDSAALCGASSCLAQVPEIINPVEQVKYLFNRFRDKEPRFLNIPWAWLTHCLDQGLVVKLPHDEEWVNLLFINRANFVGGHELVLKFLSGCSVSPNHHAS